MSRTSVLTIGAAIAALAMASTLAGCGRFDDPKTVDAKTAAREKPGLPTRIACVENGTMVLDDFVKEEDGGYVSQNSGYVRYMKKDGEESISVMGTCIVRPQAIPVGWKPIYPGT